MEIYDLKDKILGNSKDGLKGLDLAQAYWEELGRPAFERDCPEILGRASIGLVGEGSECYGFDDDISRDHDWGPGFCVWLSDGDYREFGARASRVYAGLPASFKGFTRLRVSDMTSGRVGVMSAQSFYARYTGFDRLPSSIFEWRCIPENGLCVVTNGRLFEDNCREFSRLREGFMGFYPEDLRRKKLAKSFALAAQSGQYNFSRCARRGENVAAFMALSEFIQNVQTSIFLINKRYMPYYKWTQRALSSLPVLGTSAAPKLEMLTQGIEFHKKVDIIEDLSASLINWARTEGLSADNSDFLMPHAMEIQASIKDPELAKMHVMAD